MYIYLYSQTDSSQHIYRDSTKTNVQIKQYTIYTGTVDRLVKLFRYLQRCKIFVSNLIRLEIAVFCRNITPSSIFDWQFT